MAVSSPQGGEKYSFFPRFPLAEFMAEAFCWLFPWNFKEKGISHLLWHSHFLSVKQVLQLVAWPFHGYGCLISIMKTYSLFPSFPLSGFTVEELYWLSPWNFKKENINRLLWYRLLLRLDFLKGSVIVCGCFISTVRWKYSLFLRFSSWRNTGLRHFVGYPCGTSRKKASTIFYDKAFWNKESARKKFGRFSYGFFRAFSCWKGSSDCGKQAVAGRP